jgi:hypothetical protein
MKKLQSLLLTPVLLVLLTSAAWAGDMHSDVKSPSSPQPVTAAPDASEVPANQDVEYFYVIVDALRVLLSVASVS